MEISLGIVGCRDYDDFEFFCKTMDAYVEYIGATIRVVVSGGAPGIDDMAEDWAKARGYKFKRHDAIWEDEQGNKIPSAGYIRNAKIIDDSSHVIAFWDGKSSGTKHSYNLAFERKRAVTRIKITCTPKRYYCERKRKAFEERRNGKS